MYGLPLSCRLNLTRGKDHLFVVGKAEALKYSPDFTGGTADLACYVFYYTFGKVFEVAPLEGAYFLALLVSPFLPGNPMVYGLVAVLDLLPVVEAIGRAFLLDVAGKFTQVAECRTLGGTRRKRQGHEEEDRKEGEGYSSVHDSCDS